jgi:ferredoxin
MEPNKEYLMSASIKDSDKTLELLNPEARVIKERCVGCQECVIRCPTLALSMDVVNWIAKADNSLCVGCRQCERTCPFSAITVSGPLKVAARAPITPVKLRVEPGSMDEVSRD